MENLVMGMIERWNALGRDRMHGMVWCGVVRCGRSIGKASDQQLAG